ncbi:MAG: adenylate/guanylate cyclase domain-containing protein [bacterium]|nr:adenylate/guanylate cyclase domain-containing protein [bacterium]
MKLQIKKKNILRGLTIGLVIALAVDALYMSGAFETLELKTFDLRTRIIRKDMKAHDDIALVLIDEASLKSTNSTLGRWPWPRWIYGDLLEYFAMGGAKTIAFDIIFPEYEDAMKSGDTIGANDELLVEGTAMAGNVFHAAQIIVDVEDELNKSLLNKPLPQDFIEAFSVKTFEKKSLKISPYNNFYLPFRELYEVSRGVGVVEFADDSDGIYRKTKLFRQYQGDFFPVLSMAILMDELKPEKISKEKGKLVMSDLEIPLLDDGQYLINMYKNFNTYSISGILSSIQKIQQGELENLMVDPAEFENKIVIIGASATGVEDLKPTAMGKRMPGVMLHASLVSNVLKRDFLRVIHQTQTRLIIYSGTLFLGLLILTFRRILFQIAFPIGAAIGYIAVSFWGFRGNLVLDLIPPMVSILGVWIGSFTYLYFSEGKDKRKARKMLGQYVSPAVLNDLIEQEGAFIKAEVGAKERLTILFSDIRGFTSLSEHLKAEQVVELLNIYLSKMVDIIFANRGTLDKFIGDAVMAFWGAPIRVDDHAKRCVKAGLEMARSMQGLNREFVEKGFPELRVGIGVHTGEVILGNIGSEKKLDYTIIGDHVNLTSRLEGLTKPYGCDMLISESTYMELNGEFPCRVVDNVRVKGKEEPIKVYSVLALDSDPKEELERKRKMARFFNTAFNHYINRDFVAAMEMYTKASGFLKSDKVSELFIQRCRNCIEQPPPDDWDGVFTMATK